MRGSVNSRIALLRDGEQIAEGVVAVLPHVEVVVKGRPGRRGSGRAAHLQFVGAFACE